MLCGAITHMTYSLDSMSMFYTVTITSSLIFSYTTSPFPESSRSSSEWISISGLNMSPGCWCSHGTIELAWSLDRCYFNLHSFGVHTGVFHSVFLANSLHEYDLFTQTPLTNCVQDIGPFAFYSPQQVRNFVPLTAPTLAQSSFWTTLLSWTEPLLIPCRIFLGGWAFLICYLFIPLSHRSRFHNVKCRAHGFVSHFWHHEE